MSVLCLNGNCHEQLTWKWQPELFKFWFKPGSMQGKNARIWRAFGSERDKRADSIQKSRFCERKVARKPGMLTQTNLLKCMCNSSQFPFNIKCSICTWYLYITWSDIHYRIKATIIKVPKPHSFTILLFFFLLVQKNRQTRVPL